MHGELAYFSGIGPVGTVGIVGDDLDVEAGYDAARATALLVFRRIVDAFESLDAVARWIKVLGFVRSAPGFGAQPAVINGFSDLVTEVYGAARGRCARSGDRGLGASAEHARGGRGDRRAAIRCPVASHRAVIASRSGTPPPRTI